MPSFLSEKDQELWRISQGESVVTPGKVENWIQLLASRSQVFQRQDNLEREIVRFISEQIYLGNESEDRLMRLLKGDIDENTGQTVTEPRLFKIMRRDLKFNYSAKDKALADLLERVVLYTRGQINNNEVFRQVTSAMIERGIQENLVKEPEKLIKHVNLVTETVGPAVQLIQNDEEIEETQEGVDSEDDLDEDEEQEQQNNVLDNQKDKVSLPPAVIEAQQAEINELELLSKPLVSWVKDVDARPPQPFFDNNKYEKRYAYKITKDGHTEVQIWLKKRK